MGYVLSWKYQFNYFTITLPSGNVHNATTVPCSPNVKVVHISIGLITLLILYNITMFFFLNGDHVDGYDQELGKLECMSVNHILKSVMHVL